uniref:Uncharacterized protein n=1 Tax=Percolomonas cosmopolitus TaxID=63605 RepID=A0A7S1KSD7_9EUKA|mmetsp:Transcript_7514/g.28207  ORF Transcript_7514/g.28207 Transcript_7514/m.28207 type:complete len:131 (+) Transcript_7514:50-442(+)|eukprot:CAMPEP_0117445016 /NCGR_PEP_ID=MMETSP0759-20121206/5561_1 /TAXON_ID=63605 /ORGANISM="Percolomonas cosmopolitus, Strain WS" /LENGTH=130 /DNA_ID=CAMNT_0005237145 /DNA_START=21 /DNA_END=413 /DNA_ORIENTATION=-
MLTSLSRRTAQSLVRTNAVRAFSTTHFSRAAETLNPEEETPEQKIRRQIQEEEGVDYITKFPRKGMTMPPMFPEFESELEDHIRVGKEMTFWPYIHATAVAVIIFYSVQAWLERKARLNKIFNEKFGLDL